MNLERWISQRKPEWTMLEDLLKILDRSGIGKLDNAQLKDLGRLYRVTSADLSRARALKLGAEVEGYLNNLVVRAHNQVYQRDKNRWKDLFHFLWIGFPDLVRQNIFYIALGFLLFTIPCVGSYCMVQKDPTFAQLEIKKGEPIVSEDLWDMIEKKHMWTDAAQDQSPTAFGMIATNNIRVSILAFVLGITFGFGTIYILIVNGMSIGSTFGVCQLHGMALPLMAFVAGHGVLELSAIFISGGAGLVLGKHMLFPGKLRWPDSLKVGARIAFGIFAGTVPMLLIAGSIEGFVSPRTDLSVNTKILVSLATAVGLAAYLFVPRGKPKISSETAALS